MAIKDQAVNLVLKVKNLLSSGTDAAADSVDNLGDSAEALKGKLRSLEDQGNLVKQFQGAEKAVDRTSAAWERAKVRIQKLTDKIGDSGPVTKDQAAAMKLAGDAADVAEKEFKKAEKTFSQLGDEVSEAGIDLKDLNKTQRETAKEATKARRALADFNDETEKGSGRLANFRKGLSQGVSTFVKWGAAAAAATAAASVVVLTRFTAGQADLARQTLATSDALGINTQSLQEWQYAAERVGIESDKIADTMKDVSEKIGDAFLTGGGEAFDVIKGLNLDIKELIRLSPDEQLLKISEQLNGLPKSGQILILESLASDASLLLPLLDNNAAKLKELKAIAAERGVLISEEDLKKLAETNEAFKRIGDRLTEFQNKLASQLAPTFKEIAGDFDEFLSNSPGLIEDIVGGFSGLITSTKTWVNSVLDSREQIGQAFTSIGNTLSFFGSTGTAVFKSVQTLASGLTTYVFGLSTALSGLVELAVRGANLIGLASDEAVQAASARTNALAQTTADLASQTKGYALEVVAAGESAIHAFDKTGSSAKSAGDLIRAAAAAANELAGATEESGQAAEEAARKTALLNKGQAQLGREIVATAAAIEVANTKWSEDPSEENLNRLEALKNKYKELQQVLSGLSVSTPNVPDDGGVNGGENFFDNLADSADGAADATDGVSQSVSDLSDESQAAGDSVQQVGEDAEASAGSVGAAIGNIFNGWSSRVAALSEKAGAAFQRAMGGGTAEATTELGNRLEFINYQLQDMKGRLIGAGPLGGVLRDWAGAALETEQAFLKQAIAVEAVTDKILEGDRSSQLLRMSAEQVEQQFNLLDGSQLAPLIGAIQSARREVEGLNDSLLDTIAAAEQELASLRGNQVEVERLRHMERRGELQEQLAKATALADKDTIANAERALALADEAYKLRVDAAKERTESERQRQQEYEQRQAQQKQDAEREERQDISRTEERTQTQTTQLHRAISNQTVTLNLQANGNSLGSLSGLQPDQVAALVRAIEQSTFLTTG